jgi:hypothetical protein
MAMQFSKVGLLNLKNDEVVTSFVLIAHKKNVAIMINDATFLNV